MKRHLWAAILLMSTALGARAGTVEDEGFVVHYSATPTMALNAPVAERYGIQRRASHALLLLSTRHVVDGQPKPVPAQALGAVRRLTGQRQALAFRAIEIEGQHDLVAEFEIPNGEQLAFDLSVLIEGAPRPIDLRFLQKLYRE